MEPSIQLLSTKLFVPPARSTLVPRPRLMARLSQGLTRPLTLISAPAGFGKTTLISEWRASNAGHNYPLACISLEDDDNDPNRFLTYLAAALGTLKPDLAESAIGILQTPQPPPPQAFLTSLINDLGELRTPFALVLDDYHVMSAQPVHAALNFLLNHLPQPMHLVLLTRSDPPLPLARLRASGQMVEIRADDLRFTTDEAVTFFNQVIGLALSPAEVAGLEQRTEGWIAGLQLAALALQGTLRLQGTPARQAQRPFQAPRPVDGSGDAAGFITAFTGSHHYVADYLVAEVLSRQPEPVRSFLLRTSILNRLSGPLCDAVIGNRETSVESSNQSLISTLDSQAILEYLERANLFLVPLDEERRWYRYHHLFADVLRTQLRQAYPDHLAGLHTCAAEWYEENGFVPEAISHALAAGDRLRAARLIEKNAMAMLMRGEAVTVLAWISAIEPLAREHPWIAIQQSWAFICTGQLEALEPVLQTAEDGLKALIPGPEVDGARYHIAGIRALAAVRRGDAHGIHLATQTLELLPESDPIVHGIILFALGEARWSAGDLGGARRAFAEACQIDRAVGNYLGAVLALSYDAALLTEQGQLHHAAEVYQAAVQIATRPNGRLMPAAAQACLGLAGLAYEWNDLDKAERDAQQALDLGRRWGNPDTLAGTHLVWARLKQVQGDAESAYGSLREAEKLAQGQGVKAATAQWIDALRVRLWLADGNLETVMRWQRDQTLDPHAEIVYQQQIPYLTLARVWIAQNQADAALMLLERLLVQVDAFGQMGRTIDVLILQSLARADLGDPPGALAALARALAVGQAEGYIRAFLDEGAPMAKLLRQAGSHGVSPKVVARLLALFDSETGTNPAAKQPLIEPLTERELEVLHLLAEGLSNQEIARQLVIALGTAKTHTASLYRKLDVISRTQAVARARDLGLL